MTKTQKAQHICAQCGEEAEIVAHMVVCKDCGYEQDADEQRAWECYTACNGIEGNPVEAIEGAKRALKRALINAEQSYQESNLACALRNALKELGEGEV